MIKNLVLSLFICVLYLPVAAADDIIPDSDMSANDQDSSAINDNNGDVKNTNIKIKKTDPIYKPDEKESVRYVNPDGIVIEINDTLKIITNN